MGLLTKWMPAISYGAFRPTGAPPSPPSIATRSFEPSVTNIFPVDSSTAMPRGSLKVIPEPEPVSGENGWGSRVMAADAVAPESRQ
jgi:hypothetical protein